MNQEAQGRKVCVCVFDSPALTRIKEKHRDQTRLNALLKSACVHLYLKGKFQTDRSTDYSLSTSFFAPW